MPSRTDAACTGHVHHTFGRSREEAVAIVERAPDSAREDLRRLSELFPESCSDCTLYALANDLHRAGY